MRCYLIAILFSLIYISSGLVARRETFPQYWEDLGQTDLNKALHKFNNLKTNRAKNVIIFLGDGMSLSTVVAGRILKGQRSGVPGVQGEETVTALDSMPHTGLLKTYSVDHQTPDSAATATAYLCGVKTRNEMLGLTAKSDPHNCQSSKGNEVKSIMDLAREAGKSTGIVTTTRVQHATPGGSYAKTPSRLWYSDKHLPTSARSTGCKDIALQLRETNFTVVLGGGRSHMRPRGVLDEEYPSDARGSRRDQRDLIREWINEKPRGKANYVWNKQQFDQIDPDRTDYLMGLFEPFEMKFALDNKHVDTVYREPTIAEMTSKAIKILRKNDEGFVLLVEGGLIDKGHHKAKPQYSLEEFLEFEKAVKVGKDLTSDSDTLIVVTADHGHVFTIGVGTPVRGNPVLGLAPDDKRPQRAVDGKYYTSIAYGNGPGRRINQKKLREKRLSDENTDTRSYVYEGTAPTKVESHSAEDVVAFASGPMAHLMHGVHEQTYVAHLMMYAACLGPNKAHCNRLDAKLKQNDFLGNMENDLMNPLPFEEDEENYLES